ncbi:MAG: glycerophosphoryl diester phosphodiesterase membrane domain-containing protein [Ruminococcus sp.]|nr:glycerophosphoryl diester phosphodiesterase membrane domain-containing protein [Ruminococcus sp.]
MKKRRLLPYRQAIPAILALQIIAYVVLQLWMLGLSVLSRLLMKSGGRVAVTSGDLKFLFTSWQGIVLIVLAVLTLMIYISIDINATIILTGRLLNGEKPNVFGCIKEGVLSLKKMFGPRGLLVVLYLSLLSPIIGFGVSISLTSNFYIPKFITSVIYNNPVYLIGVIVVVLALLIVGVFFSFILHGALLDKMTLKESAKTSIGLFRKNWKNYLFEVIRYVLIYTIAASVIVILLGYLPANIISFVSMPQSVQIWLVAFFLMMGSGLLMLFVQLFTPMCLLKLSCLYYKYQSGGEWAYQPRPKRKSPLVIVFAVVFAAITVLLAFVFSSYYDVFFPSETSTVYIAHRAGGSDAPENTVAGIEKAYDLGAEGCEIDIQRTSDGYYVVNHDTTFARVAGVDKKPSEMTLEEVKELKVDGEPVPTLEDMLEASRDKVTLFVELKGETADEQMADDAIRIIKEMNMADQTVLISLKYDLINYIESNYPEMQTGYLAFASFGDTASLNCDYIALEEESVSTSLTDEIHNNGKKLLVWTINDEEDLNYFLFCGADGIITDSVSQAKQIKESMKDRSPVERVFNYLVDQLTNARK